MSRGATHIIQRQVFELSTSHSKEGLQCQQQASHYLHNLLMPKIEECFNQLDLGEQHLVIDKLEIDLGSFTKGRFETEAPQKLIDALSGLLRSYMSKASAQSSGQAGEETEQLPAQLLDHAQTFFTVLKHFLVHGRLPWWFKLPASKANAQPDVLFEIQLAAALKADQKNALLTIIRTQAAARTRLTSHFSATWLGYFLQEMGLAGTVASEQWHLLMKALTNAPTLPSSMQVLLHQHFWMAWIEAGFSNVLSINLTLLIEKAAGGYNEKTIELAKAIHAICTEQYSEPARAGYAESIEKYLQHKMPYDEFRKQFAGELIHTGDATAFGKKEQSIDAEESSTFNKQQKEKDQPGKTSNDKKNSLEEDALFVPATGLVILHPFLKELFSSTGLWQQGKWAGENSVYKAIQLLGWLAYGESEVPEYQLPFMKVLAGLDLEAPLPAQEPLTEETIDTCNELLQAVIGHWTALRNSSPAALQEGFLQRSGKLTSGKKGYQLTVERLAQDVLLERLPWGYSMIKLPWMENMLHVTWL